MKVVASCIFLSKACDFRHMLEYPLKENTMAHIIAGYLQQQEEVQEVIARLVGAGFVKDKISTFYVNPAGQHDLFPIGGDRDKSPGAQESGEGSTTGLATGGVIGAVVGSAGMPFAGPLAPALGALVGAHIGSLAGGMSSMKERGESEDSEEEGANTLPQRKSGMIVAISLTNATQEGDVIQLLQTHDAQWIERAEGTISDGNWTDFDPLTSPVLVNPKAEAKIEPKSR
jgi:hypothetical protein